MIFSQEDYQKFRELRITHLAAPLEELLADENNDAIPPEDLFRAAADQALSARAANRVDKPSATPGSPSRVLRSRSWTTQKAGV